MNIKRRMYKNGNGGSKKITFPALLLKIAEMENCETVKVEVGKGEIKLIKDVKKCNSEI